MWRRMHWFLWVKLHKLHWMFRMRRMRWGLRRKLHRWMFELLRLLWVLWVRIWLLRRLFRLHRRLRQLLQHSMWLRMHRRVFRFLHIWLCRLYRVLHHLRRKLLRDMSQFGDVRYIWARFEP